MPAKQTDTIPKMGDRVRIGEEPGLCEVVDINMLMQTADLKSTDGTGHVTRNVSWTSLRFQGAGSR